jgi:outer membrane usher protein
MQRLRLARAAESLIFALIVLGSLLVSFVTASEASERKAPQGGLPLQLEVWINGYPANIISPFVLSPDGRLSMARGELDELDILPPTQGDKAALVRLDDIKGFSFRYDEPGQKIYLTLPDRQRRPKVYEARKGREPVSAAKADYGLLLNYALYSSAEQGYQTNARTAPNMGFNGANASLDARVIMPFGTFSQTAMVGYMPRYSAALDANTSDNEARRLSSTFTHLDPERFMTYRAGDFISSGLAWTQPIRAGGFQLQRNFVARPDILTQSLPSYSGSAAAPSTVDVYVNNVKSYSQQVGSGPFQLSNLPVVGSGGEARVVVRDATGKETEQKVAFYTAPSLLKAGLYEYSVDGGFARYDYGLKSDTYDSRPIGTVNLRAGITDWLTGELHAEGGLGLANGGAGAVVNAADRAIVSVALLGSVVDNDMGLQAYGGIDTRLGKVNVHAETKRAFGKYEDLAITTARLRTGTFDVLAGPHLYNYQPVRSRDLVSFSLPIEFDQSSISATYLQSEYADGSKSRIATFSYARPFVFKSTLFATAFVNVDNVESAGFVVSASFPLSTEVAATTSFSQNGTGSNAVVEVSKPAGDDVGAWGWRVRDTEGDSAVRAGYVTYQASAAKLEASVQQTGGAVRETMAAAGSVVVMGGKIHLTNTINDGFAVVNAGAPGVRVLNENRFVGETGDDGIVLVPGLRSNQKNKISIDPEGLPVNAEIESAEQDVVPAFKSGVYVDFKVKRQAPSAIVVLKRPDGKFVDAGSNGRLDGGNEAFLVGYGGQAYVKNLQSRNTVVVTVDKGECRASFRFTPKLDTQVVVGPVVCE